MHTRMHTHLRMQTPTLVARYEREGLPTPAGQVGDREVTRERILDLAQQHGERNHVRAHGSSKTRRPSPAAALLSTLLPRRWAVSRTPLPYYECSAKTGDGVMPLFEGVAGAALRRL